MNDDPARSTSSPTHGALLEAGRRLFARRGYDGASVRAITTAAGANLGAVTYHFGSKRALYEAVLEGVVSPLRERVAEAAAVDGASLERVGRVIRSFFGHLAENPDMPQLLLQEVAAGKAPPPPVERTLGPILRALAGVISAGQKAGEIRAGDPLLLALSCVAQPVHLTLVHRWTRRLAGFDVAEPAEPGERERVVEHAVAFAVAGLAAVGEGS